MNLSLKGSYSTGAAVVADRAGEAWVEKSLKRGLCRPKAQHLISQLTVAQASIYKTKLLFWLVIALCTLGKKNHA